MNNFLKIIIAGSIATILQRSIGLNPTSIKGFAFFMLVFVVISFIWQYFFRKNEAKEENAVSEQKIANRNFLLSLKKPILILFTLIGLNSVVNFISYQTGLFDDEFKYRQDTNKAVALTFNDTYINVFYKDSWYYFLYEHKGKYYLLKKHDRAPKKSVLTLFSKIYMSDIYNNLKDEKNFADILKNLSPTVYEEVSIIDMVIKPLWFSNSSKHIYWLSEDYKEYKNKYEKYNQKKERLKKEKLYKSLLNKNIKTLKNDELEITIKKLYSYYAFTKDTRYVISLFDELGKREVKFKDKKLYVYEMELMSFLYLFRTKEKLNNILKKYKMGVVYTFTFWDNQPVDIPKQKQSHLRLVNMEEHTRLLLWKDKLKDIAYLSDRLIFHLNNEEKVEFNAFNHKDIKDIGLKLNAMVSTIYHIEKKFNNEQK